MIVLYMIKYRREGDIIRQKRIWYPGATYHAMARGIRRMVIGILKPTVGIVGARRCTQDAKQCCIELTRQCIKEQEIVISGMAKGIDACAGTVCVNSGSYTVAIVGNGLDICYPAEHERLMERIRETGLLLSEYPPGTEPSNYTFPQRNRLIASWSDRLIVIAAGRGSGAMITANCADKYGRKVSFY